jgi:hypothetical protein
VDFKKQLKQEFKCLLGNEPSLEKQETKAVDLIAPALLQMAK